MDIEKLFKKNSFHEMMNVGKIKFQGHIYNVCNKTMEYHPDVGMRHIVCKFDVRIGKDNHNRFDLIISTQPSFIIQASKYYPVPTEG